VKETTVAWMSAGVSSAVATKLVLGIVERIVYIDIEDQHPDSLRFVRDCEAWYGRSVEIIQSPLGSVENAVRMAGGRGYINGPAGAACSLRLKRRVREQFECDNAGLFRYVWGYDATERNRADRIRETMPEHSHLFPLIDNRISKDEAHRMLAASGIRRPAMYDMGYQNNNCVGCVKGGKGYWNKIRDDFPDVFASRAKLERLVGASCIKGTYLDELAHGDGRAKGPIVDSCGLFCVSVEGVAAARAGAEEGKREAH
jgi:hypothetical protein